MAVVNGLSPSQIVDMAIDYTYSRQFWDLSQTAHETALYRYLNRTYKEVYNAVLDLDKNYFRDYWTADLVAGQSEYSLEKVLSPKHVGQYKVEKVHVKYPHNDVYDFTVVGLSSLPEVGSRYGINQTVFEVTYAAGDRISTKRVTGNYVPDQFGYLEKVGGVGPTPIPYKSYVCPYLTTQGKYYRSARLSDYDSQHIDPLRLQDHQPESDPIAIISADSVFIYPAPTKPVLAGIKFEGAKKMYKLDKDMKAEDVMIPELFHELLMIGMSSKMYKHQGMKEDAAIAEQEYQTKLSTALDRLDTRQTTPVLGVRQDNSNFE